MNGKTICATNSVYDSDNKLKYDKKILVCNIKQHDRLFLCAYIT